MSIQDQSGITRLRENGVAELADIFLKHRDNLKRLIAGRINGKLKARFDESDIVQEVFIRAKNYLQSYLDSPNIPPAVWLRILTKQLLAENIRKNMRSVRSPDFEVNNSDDHLIVERLADSLHSICELLARRELMEVVRSLLTDLSEVDRAIVEMRHAETMSFPEISKVVELSMEATKKRYYRTLEKLNKLCDFDPNNPAGA